MGKNVVDWFWENFDLKFRLLAKNYIGTPFRTSKKVLASNFREFSGVHIFGQWRHAQREVTRPRLRLLAQGADLPLHGVDVYLHGL